ncbi:hypothetical protein BGZ76_011690 [Entomortierella beljakovae]|nr:hypothetical protein BGZ76_011690 [Entomortierella beljakovae]
MYQEKQKISASVLVANEDQNHDNGAGTSTANEDKSCDNSKGRQGDKGVVAERQFAFSCDSLMAQKGTCFCMDYGLDKVTPDTFTILPMDENVEKRTANKYKRSINLCQEAVGRAKQAAESLEDDDLEEYLLMDRKRKKAHASDISSVSSGSSQPVNSVQLVSAVREKKPVVGNNFGSLVLLFSVVNVAQMSK